MKNFLGGCALLSLLLGSQATRVTAQDTTSRTVIADKLLATVGKTAIMQSMVDERLFASYNPSQMTPAVLVTTRRMLLDTLMADEMLYQEALRDTSLHVSDQEVSEAVDRQIKAQRASRTVAQFEAALLASGYKSADELRLKSIDDIRRQFYIDRFTASLREKGLIKPLNPMEREVRAFYDREAAAGHLDIIPPTVMFKQIVVAPRATPAALAKAKLLADSLIKVLRDGADFSTIARQFSMDPGTRDLGGDLKWCARGACNLDRTFEDAAFALKPGQISEPVLTPFGYHIIQLERKLPNEAHIFHILIVPEVDSAGVEATRLRAEDIRAALKKGASFDSIQRLVHDQLEQRGTDWPTIPDSLPPTYSQLKTMSVGDVSDVIALPSQTGAGPAKYAILLLTGKFPEGPLPYEIAREGIKKQLAIQYGQDAYLKELRRRIYVDIRNQ